MITDQTRGKFLAALANAPFEITEWEAGFVASYLKRTDKEQVSFSAQQRAIIDRMMKSYLHRLPLPQPVRAPLPETVPGRCGWLMGTSPQVRCNAPAGHRLPRGLELCNVHKNESDQFLARQREARRRRLT